LCGTGEAFHALTHNREAGSASRELALAFTQTLAAQVTENFGNHITETERPCGVARANDMQPLAVCDRAAGDTRPVGRRPVGGLAPRSMQFLTSVGPFIGQALDMIRQPPQNALCLLVFRRARVCVVCRLEQRQRSREGGSDRPRREGITLPRAAPIFSALLADALGAERTLDKNSRGWHWQLSSGRG
jgi:hypothetical protein